MQACLLSSPGIPRLVYERDAAKKHRVHVMEGDTGEMEEDMICGCLRWISESSRFLKSIVARADLADSRNAALCRLGYA